MSATATTAEVDTIAAAHLADMITTITGDDSYDTVADMAARIYRGSETAAHAARSYAANQMTDSDFAAVVASVLS
jgi:hypothetical protein